MKSWTSKFCDQINHWKKQRVNMLKWDVIVLSCLIIECRFPPWSLKRQTIPVKLKKKKKIKMDIKQKESGLLQNS